MLVKNHNTNNSNTYNSVGGYYNPSGTSKIKFVRDPEKLLVQYSNLIKATAKKYNKYWASEADRKELYSYIVDTFISLVYEYDINSEVDFQGYIKRMLDIRVNKSYSIPEKEKRDHISTLRSPVTTVENLVDAKQMEGSLTNSTWFNSKNSDHKVADESGELHGVDSKLDSVNINDSLDTSLIELMDRLEHDDRIDYIQLQVMRYLIYNPYKQQDVLNYIGKRYHFSKKRMKEEFNQLKMILLEDD